MTKKEQKRILKKSSRLVGKCSPVSPFFFLLLGSRTASCAWKFFFTILKDFFALQMGHILHIKRRPVIYVDTDIDEKVPFSPSHVEDYMSFVSYLLTPFSFFFRCFGYKKGSFYMNMYLNFLRKIYANASSIYRFCLTTTVRPRYLKNAAFRSIHFFDPHLLCVPSIHVSVAAGTYAWFKQFFQLGLFPQEISEIQLDAIKKHCLRIIESVLFVKQHSVNCIPMAMYMLTSTMHKSFFSIDDATELIDELFKNSDEISEEEKVLIRNHFHFIYERSLLENIYSANWQKCVQHWLIDHAKQTGQKLDAPFTND